MHTPRSLAVIALLVILATGACQDVAATRGSAAPAVAGGTANEPANRLTAPHARARVVTMELVAGEVRRASAGLRRALSRREGWVASALEQRLDEGAASFDLRVPAAGLDAFRADVRRLGDVTMDREEVEDVGEQQFDLEARLRNARREEERLLALVSERAASLGDVVALEARLGEVRERIEVMDASARLLADRVEYARVHVDVRPRPMPYWKQPVETLSGAGRWGLDAVQAVVVGGAAAIVGLGPTALVLVGVLLGLVAAVRALASRKAARARA